MLSGCATQVPGVASVSMSDLSRTGRFALKAEEFGREPEAVQGGFTWIDSGQRLTLDLTNPFGNVLARVVVDSGIATLIRSNGEILQAATPDELVAMVLGQSIPVQGLREWLRLRLPDRAIAAMTGVTRDAQGYVDAFNQNGWRVQRSRFDERGPRLLVLSRNDQGKAIHIRLVIDNP